MNTLWEEMFGENHERKPATPKPKLPPGHYDDCEYYNENEEGFGVEVFNQELAKIRRQREQQEND